MGMIDNIRSATDVTSAQELLDTLTDYEYASAKTIRRAVRAVSLREKELNTSSKKKTKKKS